MAQSSAPTHKRSVVKTAERQGDASLEKTNRTQNEKKLTGSSLRHNPTSKSNVTGFTGTQDQIFSLQKSQTISPINKDI